MPKGTEVATTKENFDFTRNVIVVPSYPTIDTDVDEQQP
jgi:hypothetical protein